VAAIPEGRRPSVYYARGPRGLETGLRGSINVESLERIGARNVAADRPAQSGIATVSKEQILGWDPEVIVTIDAAFMETVRADSRWRGVRAVRDGRVYCAPLLPFPWIDFPPSVNRLIGLARLEIVVLRVRGPHILAAVTIGAALAAPGTAYQGLFRNPLVSPDILGVSSGAALGAVIGIYLSLSLVAGQTLAFAVGLGAVGALCASGAALPRHDHVLVLVLGGIVGA
jgi:ABC-type Fe3+-siderophore transport system permease subunit